MPEECGVRICFVDDYQYDSCDEAIAEGYRYELIAYTQEEYSYFGVVFTGLPVISVYTQEPLSTEDSRVAVLFSRGEQGLRAGAQMHMRGNGTLEKYEKKSYKLTLTEGGKKKERQIPGLCETDELILLSMIVDDTLMSDRLGWMLAGVMMGRRRELCAAQQRICGTVYRRRVCRRLSDARSVRQ